MPAQDRPVNSELHSSERKALSVSEALDIVKGALKGIRLTIVGEVSEVSAKRGYKAVYFTVKDRSSSLSCLMWNDIYRASGVDLQIGQEVEIAGFFSLYAARGTMNFDVRRLSLAGEGRLRMEVARLAKKLESEGLMDPARKRKLPRFPKAVGLVTSPSGDAVHDVLRTLRRRWPQARVVLAGVQVEGANAPRELVRGLSCAAAAGVDLVILGRGGGPYENMMPFNDEGLARAIVACPVPVVTGIGHEPDNFIADMVADVRASTPTLAAAVAVPDRAEFLKLLSARAASLSAAMRRVVDGAQASVRRLSDRPVLKDAHQLFAQDAMAVDHLASRLERVLPANIDKQRNLANQLSARLFRVLEGATSHPRSALARQSDRLALCLSSGVPRFQQQVGLRAARLHDLSPLATLGRGYAIARDASGAIVKRVAQVNVGQPLAVTVSDGVVSCRVESANEIRTDTVPL